MNLVHLTADCFPQPQGASGRKLHHCKETQMKELGQENKVQLAALGPADLPDQSLLQPATTCVS